MNKLFIGLLILAAGAGVYFLLRKKEKTEDIAGIVQEDILGKWKTDPAKSGIDSNAVIYNYEFTLPYLVFQSLNDSSRVDTLHYSLTEKSEMVWKEKPTDSAGMVFGLHQFGKDSLQLQSKDSVKLLLIRVK